MFKLVVLSVLIAIAAAKPHVAIQSPQIISAYSVVSAPIATATSYQSRTDIVNKPVVAQFVAAPVPVIAPAPVIAPVPVLTTDLQSQTVEAQQEVEIAPQNEEKQQQQYELEQELEIKKQQELRQHEELELLQQQEIAQREEAKQLEENKKVSANAVPIAYARRLAYAAPIAYAIPITGTAYTKNIHYAEKDVITGYSQQVIKPNLGALITPSEGVSQINVQAAARAVQTVTPTVTKIEPQNVQVAQQVEVRTPIPNAAPAVTYSSPAIAYAAPGVRTISVAYLSPVARTIPTQAVISAPVAYSSPVTYSHKIIAPSAYAVQQRW